MNTRQSFYAAHDSTVGAIRIAGLYLLIGGLWILFSDKVAEKVSLNREMLAHISLYKGWGYVIVTALLLYWLIQRHTATLRAGEERLQRVLDAMPAFISYVDADRYYRFTNKAYEEGFDAQVVGKHVQEVIGEAAYQTSLKYMEKVLDGETVSFEVQVPLQDQEHFMLTTYVPDITANRQVKGFFVMVQDWTEQKQAEEELRQWADAFEGCAHGIAISDPSTNRILVCNPAFASLHKCRVEDIVGSGVLSLFTSADYDGVRRNIERADQIGHGSFEAHMIRRDRSKFPVQMDIVSVIGEDGELLHRVLTAQDISERKSIVEKLKASETKYRTLAEHLPAITYISQPNQYIGVSYVSPQIEELGFDSETWLADPEYWFKQIHPEDQEQVSRALQQFEASDKPFKAEYRLILPNGEMRWFHDESIRVKDQDGETVLKQGFMLDITDRKQAEEALQLKDALLRLTSEMAKVGGWEFDLQTLKGTWTDEVAKIHDLDPAMATNVELGLSFYVGESRARIEQAVKEAIELGKPYDLELEMLSAKGIHKWVRTIGLPTITNGRVVKVRGMFQDITERKQAEEEIQSLARFPAENPNPVLRATAEGKIIYANAPSESLLGYWQCRVGQDLPPDWIKLIGELIHAGAKQTIELQCGDTIYSVMITPVPNANYVNLYGRDISESKRAEKAEQLERARWQGIVEGIADEVWTSDAQGKMNLLNLENVTAMGLNVFKDKSVEEVYQEVDIFYSDGQPRPPEEAPLLRSLHGETVRGEEIMRHRQTGVTRYRQFSSAPTRDANGTITGAVAIVRDITEQKAAEEGLRRFELLSQHSRDIILFIDCRDGRILEANAAALLAYGYTREELLALTIQSLRASNTQSMTANQMAQADTEGILFETIHKRKDGTTFPVEVSSQGATIGGVRSLISIIRDITERKQAEEDLRNSQAQIAGILNSAMDAIISTDADQRILIFNPAAEAMFQSSQTEALGQPLERFIPERFREAHRKYVQNFGATGVTKRAMNGSAVVFGRRSNGEEFPTEASISQMDIAGRKIYTVILRDVTERQQMEETLRADEEQYRAIFDNALDAILITDPTGGGAVLSANPAACRMFGYSMEEFIGLSRDAIIDGSDPNLAILLEQRKHGRGAVTELVYRRKDGKRFSGELSSILYQDKNGERRALSVIRDITERKQAAEALQKSEAMLRSVLDQMPSGVTVRDAYTGALILSNARSRKILGTLVDVPEQFIRYRGLHPDGRLYQSEEWPVSRSLATGEVVVAEEIECEREDGTHFTLSINSAPVRDTQGKIIMGIGVFDDITERKRAEQELQESEEKFSVIYYKAPFAAALSRLPDGTIMDVNEAFEKVLGYTKQDVIGKTSRELGINPDVEERTRITAELQTKGSVQDLELTLRTKSGAARIFLMNIDLISIGGEKYIFQTAQDITARKQVEAALQKAHGELELKVQERTAALSQANALLQALMDTVPDQVYFKDMQGRFIRNSRSQATLLGLSDPAEAIGKSDFDFFPHAARAYAEEQEVMHSAKPLIDLEEWVVWPTGGEMWVSTTKVPLRNSEGQTIGIFGISRDITERKRSEQAIRQLNADLEKQAEQLQAANKELESFSYSVSHDLRAPLRAIDGYTRILVEDYEANLDEEGKRVCGVISAEARRMGQLIDDLLAFSRLGRKEMHSTKIDMRALASSVFDDMVKEEERERIDFQVSKLPSTRGDPSLMRQVWFNLIANAIKFSSKKERAAIEVGHKQTREENIYYVRDNGAGFDMEYANKLFGVFQRLHSESEFDGTGVGLAIVQRIIHRHSGYVWAQGEVEKGATFYFALPRTEDHHD